MDFPQAALAAGLRSDRLLTLCLLPLALGCFHPGGVSDGLAFRWISGELTLWWLLALWCLPPTQPLWRHQRPGFMRHAAPVLSCLALAQLGCFSALTLLLYAAARTEGLWQSLLRALAAWGALLMGQALCLALFVRLRPGRWGVGLALLLPLKWGLDGVLYSMPAADALTFVASLAVICLTYRELTSVKTR